MGAHLAHQPGHSRQEDRLPRHRAHGGRRPLSEVARSLSHLTAEACLADTGLETDLIYNHGFELPEFTAFVLLDNTEGEQGLSRYFAGQIAVAGNAGRGIVLENPTWRANPD